MLDPDSVLTIRTRRQHLLCSVPAGPLRILLGAVTALFIDPLEVARDNTGRRFRRQDGHLAIWYAGLEPYECLACASHAYFPNDLTQDLIAEQHPCRRPDDVFKPERAR